ncbi:MAG: hypothetical protein Q7U16_02175 [Agitococcus sp.]|nr:hypothetical protein [Agitococcus sp.]
MLELGKIRFIVNSELIAEELLVGTLSTAHQMHNLEVNRCALEQKHGLAVSVVHEHPANNPVTIEIVTTEALTLKNSDTQLARVAIWHAHQLAWLPAFESGQLMQKEDFSLSGTLLLPDSSNVLSLAFNSSNNSDSCWNPLIPRRSSSVGDVFVVTHANGNVETVVVASVNFVPVIFKETGRLC